MTGANGCPTTPTDADRVDRVDRLARHDGKGSPREGRPPAGRAVDAHGRSLTTSADAAAWYRIAQRFAPDAAAAVVALRAALAADEGFVLAAAGLGVLTGDEPTPGPGPLTRWERRHVEVAAAAARRDGPRAVGLLREHLTEVGCDPVTLLVVAARAGGAAVDQLEDVLAQVPPCHHRRGGHVPR